MLQLLKLIMRRSFEKKLYWLFITKDPSEDSVFYVRMHFALRGVEEQYSLVPNQFIRFLSDTTIYESHVTMSTLNLFLRIISIDTKIVQGIKLLKHMPRLAVSTVL